MGSHNATTEIYDQYRQLGDQVIADPGAGGTFDLRGRWGGKATIASGTRKLPDNVPECVVFYVIATGSVTITNVAGTTVATLASGEVAGCVPTSSTEWAATIFTPGAIEINTAADLPIVDGGSYTDATEVETALQSALQAAYAIRVPMTSFVDADGDPLVKFANAATPDPGFNLANSEAFGIRWNDNPTQDEPVLTSVVMPILNTTDVGGTLTLHVVASKTGATVGDATTFTVTAFKNSTSVAHDASTDFGGVTSAMVGNAAAKTVQHLTLALSIPATGQNPGVLTFTITPTSGTLGTDDVIIEGIYFTYAN